MLAAVCLFLCAAVLLALGVRHLMQKGRLLNNAYLYASKLQRKTMNKKPYYRQSGIVFCLLAVLFSLLGFSVLLQSEKLLLLEIPLLAGTVFYAIRSAAQIEKQSKTPEEEKNHACD